MASDEGPKEKGSEASRRKLTHETLCTVCGSGGVLVPRESLPPSPPAGFVPLAEADRAELELVRALIAERGIQGPLIFAVSWRMPARSTMCATGRLAGRGSSRRSSIGRRLQYALRCSRICGVTLMNWL